MLPLVGTGMRQKEWEGMGAGGDGQVKRRNSVLFAPQQIITIYHPAQFAWVRREAKGRKRNILL